MFSFLILLVSYKLKLHSRLSVCVCIFLQYLKHNLFVVIAIESVLGQVLICV